MTRRRLAWAVGLPVVAGALDLTVMSAVLPVVIEDLALSVPHGVRQASWLVTGYLLAYAVGMLIGGPLGDRWGDRRVLIGAALVFVAGSVAVAGGSDALARLLRTTAYRWGEIRLPAESSVLWALVAGRVVQALGAGAVVPAGMSIGWRRFRSPSWLGLVAALDLVGWTFGHLYGGLIVRWWSWPLAFWLNVPLVGVALLLLARIDDDPSARHPVPVARLAVGATGLVGAVAGLGGVEAGTGIVHPWLLMGGVALIVGAGWNGALGPARPVALLANLLLGTAVFFVLASVPLFVAVLIEADGRRAAWLAGWLLTAFTVPMAATAWVAGRRRRPRWLLAVAGGGAVVGFVMTTGWTPSALALLPALGVLGMSLGWWFAPLAEAWLAEVPVAVAGRTSAAVLLARLAGMAVGSSLLVGVVLEAMEQTISGDPDRLVSETLAVFDRAAWLGVAVAVGLALVGTVAVRTGSSRFDDASLDRLP